MPPLCSIVIITHNQFSFTKQCLESIHRHTPLPIEIIIVDNASTDQTLEYLRSQPNLTLIENDHNRGFPAAANQGLRAARGSLLLLLNNDVIVAPGWLGHLENALASHPEVGLVGPLTNNISGPQQIPVSYADPAGIDGFAQDLARRNAKQIEFFYRLVGFCLLFRREVIDRIGLLDEQFGIGVFEDDDFCRRAIAAGFRCAIAKDAFVHHFGSITFRAGNVDLAALMRQNKKRFEQKWAPAPAPNSKLPPLGDSPRLSLCMIVRDSSATLGACLQSIRPWVEEMIVVDTGSKDNTMEIARSFGAKVFEFPWPDSFAEARNQSLSHATGDWLFWMDSDDAIDAENGRKLRALSRQKNTAMGFIMQVDCPATQVPGDDHPYSQTIVDHVKMFRNSPDIRFTGRIHEQILPSIRQIGGDVEWTDIRIVHSGSDQTAAGRIRKQQRDLRLLELELKSDPDNSFTLFNIGMTLLCAGRPTDALDPLARSLQLATPNESHCRKIYALLAEAYFELSRPDTALKTTTAGLRQFPNDAELLYRKGHIALSLGNLTEAETAFRALVERPRERYFSSLDPAITGAKAWHNLAAVLEKQNRPADAANAWQKALELDPKNPPAWRGLLDSFTRQRNVDRLEQLAMGDVPPDIRLIARSRLLILRNEESAAIALLRNSVESGGSDEILDELCRRLFNSTDLPEAQRWLAALVSRRPSDPSAHLNLAIIFLRQGNHPSAAQHARRSLELRPNYSPAENILRAATQISPPDPYPGNPAIGSETRP